MKNKVKNMILVSAMVLLVAACGHKENDENAWRYHYDLPQAKVVQAHQDFVLRYPEQAHKPYLQDEVAFKRQINDVRKDQVTEIVLVLSKDNAQQKKYITNLIDQTDLKGEPIKVVHDSSLKNQITLKITHWKAEVAGCPDWSKPTGTDYKNTNSTNFGCANAMNLAAMVDNPHDVETGRTASASSGYQSVLSVNRYRAGEVIDLRREDGILEQ